MKVNDIKINYQVKGEGEPIILIHGGSASVMHWLYQVPELSKHYKVIAYDIRGHGKTDKPKQDYSIEIFSEDLSELLNELQVDKAHIIGHSLGGMIAQQFALNFPHRISSLVLAATLCTISKRFETLLDNWILIAEELGMEAIFSQFVLWSTNDTIYARNTDFIEILKAQYLKDNDQVHAFVSVLKAVKKFDVINQLQKIKKPTLVLAGEFDILTPPEYSEVIHNKIVDSEFLVLDGAAHTLNFIEDGKPFNKVVLEFLSKLSHDR
ncbi:MAG: alpha/beta fold hydrolase [Promethearchaeota archaeon]